jgi:hypothetical protein
VKKKIRDRKFLCAVGRFVVGHCGRMEVEDPAQVSVENGDLTRIHGVVCRASGYLFEITGNCCMLSGCCNRGGEGGHEPGITLGLRW